MPGSRLRAPARFNYVDSRRRPQGFDTVAEWIEHVCRLDTLKSGDVTSRRPSCLTTDDVKKQRGV
jgi:hypothetical protein